MRRVGDLWGEIVSFEGLRQAAQRAARGQRRSPGASAYLHRLEPEIFALQEALEGDSYRPSAYRVFVVREAKTRLISAAPFRDRVVHHALCGALAPIFERRAIFDSYACRIGKGQHRAIARAQGYCRRFGYALKLDIEKFFETLPHAVLKADLRRVVKDRRALSLADRFIDLGAPGSGPGLGLPIGNLTSQHFANFALDGLDHFIKDRLRIGGYLRYMDDMLVFGDDKDRLWDVHAEIEGWLGERGLRLKGRQTCLAPVSEGVAFLGHRIFGPLIRLDKGLKRRLRRKLAARMWAYQAGELSGEGLIASTQGIVAATGSANALMLRRSWLRRLPALEV